MDFYTQLNPILVVQNKYLYSITLHIFFFYLTNRIIILKPYNFFKNTNELSIRKLKKQVYNYTSKIYSVNVY